MNTVNLIGRLTKDPETRYNPNTQAAICTFTLAVDRMSKDKGADFIRIISFGKQAEVCDKYLSKGKQVAIEGRINTGSYDDKDGKKVYTTDVVANRVEFLGSKSDDAPKEFKQDPSYPTGFAEVDDSDIPF